jgi:UDP:flavonoid glycosyltransferase YjiC (YdhE family)
MKVLFTSVSAIGHIHPMVPLAQALRDRGHQVRWATGADSCPRVQAAGIEPVQAGLDQRSRTAEYQRRYPEAAALRGVEIPDHMFPKLFGAIAPPPMLGDLTPVMSTWQPDLLIHEAGEFAGPIAATALGVPSITHGFGSLTPPHRVAAASEEVAPLWQSVGLQPRPYGGCYDHLYLDIFPASLGALESGHVPFLQPLQPVAFDASGDEEPYVADQADERPLVYLTLGTVFSDEGRLRTAVNAIASLDVRLLVTVGPRGHPEAMGPQPSHVRVERYVPQTQVLGHCVAVASHVGSGTFLAALSHALPQLCLPQAADQFINAAGCIHAGAGLALTPDDATAPAITGAMSRLLSEPSFGARASAVASELAAMPSPDEVAALLEHRF